MISSGCDGAGATCDSACGCGTSSVRGVYEGPLGQPISSTAGGAGQPALPQAPQEGSAGQMGPAGQG